MFPISPLTRDERIGNYTFDLSCPITSGVSFVECSFTHAGHRCPSLDTYRAAIAAVKVALCAARALANGDPSSGIFALTQVTSFSTTHHTTSPSCLPIEYRRPPGHHAQQSLCGGYCFFNNAAIAAKYLIQHAEARRVAILDVDYHHGNGSEDFGSVFPVGASVTLPLSFVAQQIFYGDPAVLYVSLHAQDDYPCEYSVWVSPTVRTWNF